MSSSNFNITSGNFSIELSDADSGKQPSVSLSQECSSLSSSNIEHGGRDDTGSMIPGPRSCAVSIASSIENLNLTENPSPSLAENDHVSTSSKASSQSSLKKVVQLKVASENVDGDQLSTIVAQS